MFRGTLDDFTLPEILRMLAFSNKSGTLHVARKAGTGRITFSQGNVTYAETELSSSRLGQKLVGAGKISPAQLRQALDVQATSGDRLGRVLVSSESVTRSDLQQALRAQVEEAAYELMCWEAGEFSWEPGAEEADAEVSLDIEELMREVETRLAQQAEVQLHLSRPGAVPRMVDHAPQGPGDINIRPEQWRVLVLVDGHRSVGDLAVSAGVPEADVVRTLNDLAAAGLIEAQEEVVAPEPEPAADVPVTAGGAEEEPSPATEPARIVAPSMIEASSSLRPSAVKTAPRPALNSGSSSMPRITASIASSEEPPAASTTEPRASAAFMAAR